MLSSRRPAIALAAALTGSVLVATPTGVVSAVAGPPVISEVMYDPASDEDDWEWIELHNPGDEELDLTGWVVDDNNTLALPGANIAAGSVPAGGDAVLYNADDLSAAEFEAAWGAGINLVAVTGWSRLALNNSGDTIGLWSSFAAYDGDNQTQANTVVSVAFPDIANNGGSIHLTDLSDQSSFELSIVGASTPVGDTFTSAAAGGNSGADVGSPVGTPPPGPTPVFSQYVEGSGNNKAIEIANLSAVPIDITGWELELYSNGNPGPPSRSSTITAVIAPGDVYVASAGSASAAIQAVSDENLTAVNWNGDDAIVLRDDDGAVVDSIGRVGEDPGSEWGDAAVGTQNDTLCRNPEVTEGDTDPSDAFDPATEWFPLGNDVLTGLGAIGCDGGVEPGDTALIHQIQGTGPAVAITGQVTAEAIVTSLLERDDALDGFFIQEEDVDADADPATSEGIFVFCRGGCPVVTAGDLVEVTGEAVDFFGMSQIDITGGVATVVSSGNALPSPTPVMLPAAGSTEAEATFESVEGMIVTFPDRLVVSEYFELARYGQIVLTESSRPFQFTHTNAPDVAGYAAFLDELATRRIILDDDNNDQNDAIFDGPDEAYYQPGGGLSVDNRFRGGDSIIGLSGVMHWSFAGQTGTDAWRVRPIPEVFDYSFTVENPAPESIADVGGSLQVASFNVLNYFTTIDDGASACGPLGTLGCRGAHSESERERQLDKIVAALTEIDADVVGLIEIENNATASLQSLVDALNAVPGGSTYDFVDTGTIGGDAIKVGFIYQPATVALAGDPAILDSSIDPTFIDTKNRPALIQTFDEVATGERFTAAVNHFKSKGSPCDDVGDPGLDDGQANCNLTRTMASTALANFLATDPTSSGDPDMMIIGDLNAYKLEDPITALTSAGYTDLIEVFEGPDAYSFVFDGQLGYLDHALANDTLAGQVAGVTEWHVNADEVNVFDYNDGVQDPGEASFERESAVLDVFDPDPFRSSDHDPVVVGLSLNSGPIGACPDAPDVTKIHDLQGAGAATPCAGEEVIVEGVVVADYEGSSPALRGFYVQEEDLDTDGDPATSEGVFVFNFTNDDVQLGDVVRVAGTAGEFQDQTQISSVSDITVLSSESLGLVTPTVASLPVVSADAFEAVEGMLVTFPQDLFVTEFFQLGRFGQVVVSSGDRLFNPTAVAEPGADANAVQAANDLNRLIIDDTTNDQNPDPIIYGGNGAPLTAENPLRGGDATVGATGVMTYTWAGNGASGNAYRLRPATEPIEFETRNPRPAAAPDLGGSLEVASFNVLNYFLTVDDGTESCGPVGAKDDCRGADSVEELERQRAKLLSALVEIDADVVGLIEVENTELADGTPVEPLADIVAGLNDLAGPGTWDFVDTGTIGTDVIKVGLIYRTTAVDVLGDFAVIDSSVDPRFDDGRNRPTLAQSFVDTASGEVLTVVVNHLKSKSCRDASGAETDQGDGQGCYNASRTAAAAAVVDWLAADPTAVGDTDVLVIGDLNAYANEDPIDVFAAAGYVDLAPVFSTDEPYSFVFDGQWGYLDYALASPSLVAQVTGVAEYHINADEVPVLDYNTNFQSASQIEELFAPNEFRTSDHDPILVGLDLDAASDGRLIVFPDRLWPANGRLRTVFAFAVTSTWRVLDSEIIEVTSSQADSGLSRRDRPDDIDIRSDRVVRLRAETFGPVDRTYELTIAIRSDGQLRIERETVDVVRRIWGLWW